MRRRRLLRLPLALPFLGGGLVFLPGCPGECVGADCGDAYTASRLTLKRGRRDSLGDREQSALDGVFSVVGSDAQGKEWSAILESGQIVVGLPEVDQVYSFGGTQRGDLSFSSALAVGENLLTGEGSGDRFGASLARVSTGTAADLWVGAPARQGPGTEAGAGAVYRFSGIGDGWDGEKSADEAILRILSEHSLDRLGERMAACGDLDGDGAAELLLGAPWDDESAKLAGRAYLVRSSNLANYQREILSGELDDAWSGDSEGAQLGRVLACADDLDGDGIADPVLGAPFSSAVNRSGAGAIYALSGASLPGSSRVDTAADWLVRGPSPEDYLGWAVATGDMDGDGYPELAIGAPGSSGGEGQVQLIQGSKLIQDDLRPRARVLGESASDRLGQALAIADLDGDGFGDLAVGAPRSNPTGQDSRFDAGIVLLFAGESGLSEWSVSRHSADADGLILGDEQFLRAGAFIQTADWDDDGRDDMLLLLSVQPP